MVEKHACKLCSRRFSNGRALGGHMRSHFTSTTKPPSTPTPRTTVTAAAAEATQLQRRHQSSTSSSSSFCPKEQQRDGAGKPMYGLRENPRRSFRVANAEFSDQESEAHSLSTFRRRRRALPAEAEAAVSSVSNATTAATDAADEDVAFCLIMLSMDTWEQKKARTSMVVEEEERVAEAHSEERCVASRRAGRYRCGTCGKAFRSRQALGGHKASHGKIAAGGGEESSDERDRNWERASGANRRAHECPFCGKAFASRQALGGHKRTHFSFAPCSGGTGTGGVVLMVEKKGLLDLNLPAPAAEEEEEVGSQAEVSAVSVAD